MKKWIMNLSALFKTLGFSKTKIETGLTAEEWKQVRSSYKETYGTSLDEDKLLNEDVPAEPEALTLTADETAALALALGVDKEEVPQDAKAAAKKAAEVAAQQRANTRSVEAEAKRLAAMPETEEPVDRTTAKQLFPLAGKHSETHLFGVDEELYSRKKWYNDLMANPAHTFVAVGDHEAETFAKDFRAQTKALRDRMAEHRTNGTFDALDFKALSEGKIDFSTGNSMLDTLGYTVRRQDMILAYFKSLPSVRDIFPVRSNVQNNEVAVSSIVGELSQGYRKGRIFKGAMEFDADIYHVDDLMFKFNFEDLVELEKQYIGYLNKDHSAIIKWTFIEWVMVHYGEQLIKEQNERNVIGVRTPQQNITANPSVFAADGVLAAIVRSVKENRVLPFYEIGAYNASNMLETVEDFADRLIEAAGSEADNMKIYLNARHKRWYIRAYREKYGKDADFTGSNATLVDLDPALIVWVPNMRMNDYLIWAAEPGNVELLEDKPGEMLAFSFKEELEGVAVVSRWKEGAHVQKAGKRFATEDELFNDNFRHQFLFCSWPISETVGAGLIVSATAEVSKATPEIDYFYLQNDDNSEKEVTLRTGKKVVLKSGQIVLVYPVLTESQGVVSATGWQAAEEENA